MNMDRTFSMLLCNLFVQKRCFSDKPIRIRHNAYLFLQFIGFQTLFLLYLRFIAIIREKKLMQQTVFSQLLKSGHFCLAIQNDYKWNGEYRWNIMNFQSFLVDNFIFELCSRTYFRKEYIVNPYGMKAKSVKCACFRFHMLLQLSQILSKSTYKQ